MVARAPYKTAVLRERPSVSVQVNLGEFMFVGSNPSCKILQKKQPAWTMKRFPPHDGQSSPACKSRVAGQGQGKGVQTERSDGVGMSVVTTVPV